MSGAPYFLLAARERGFASFHSEAAAIFRPDERIESEKAEAFASEGRRPLLWKADW
jgi:hypothetical protein